MSKSLSRLWWSSVKRIGKAQQRQQKKLVKSLLAKPVAAKRAPSKSTVAKRKPRSTAATTARPKVNVAATSLPGKWLASYYAPPADGRKLPPQRMTYWLYIPANAGAAPLPLVVMLHGCEQTAPQFAQGTRMNQLAEKKGFAVLYPQQSLSAHPNRCWPWYDKATQHGGGAVELIAGVIGKVLHMHALDRSRVYVAGISAGGAMANILALNFPHLIAAVGLHSTPVYGAAHTRMGALAVMQRGSLKVDDSALREAMTRFEPHPGMPAILLHGRSDQVVRPVNLAQLARQFKVLNQLAPQSAMPMVAKPAGAAGGRNPAHAYYMHDYLAGRKLMLRTCEILQLEHAWSGGDCTLRFNACGGPDASKLMWEFFARHRRPALRALVSRQD